MDCFKQVLPDYLNQEGLFLFSRLAELQDDLYELIYYYHFKRINQGFRLKSRIPYCKLLDGRQKYTLSKLQ
ncbi:MAG: hypothetical protein PHW73_10525 [Atribacterota bacterium]|nr:hypothetical protein [Atribacterota bacterium]